MTAQAYKLSLLRFCDFVGINSKQIVEDYEQLNDREFKRKYANYVKSWIASQMRGGLAPNSIKTRVGAVKSFFKYNDLPLGFVPTIISRILYHNRDITHEEIRLILDSSRPRERAFYAIMAQSGLRPNTLCDLKYENIREDFESNMIPCKIEIPQEIAKGKYHSYFTFIGEDAVKYLKSYLIVRPDIKDGDFIFLKDGTNQRSSPKSLSGLFGRTTNKLKEKGKMKLKQKKENKPHDIRLYNLRKFFRKFANQAGFEFVQFWMGHTVNAGQDDHYRPRDAEFHRKLYTEKAMPHLRFETATPTETYKAITILEQENRELKDKIEKIENVMEKMYHKVFGQEIEQEKFDKWINEKPKYFECTHQTVDYKEMCRKEEEYLAKHPEERKRREEQEKKDSNLIVDYMKELEKHIVDIEELKKLGLEEGIRLDERSKILIEFRKIINKTKK